MVIICGLNIVAKFEWQEINDVDIIGAAVVFQSAWCNLYKTFNIYVYYERIINPTYNNTTYIIYRLYSRKCINQLAYARSFDWPEPNTLCRIGGVYSMQQPNNTWRLPLLLFVKGSIYNASELILFPVDFSSSLTIKACLWTILFHISYS